MFDLMSVLVVSIFLPTILFSLMVLIFFILRLLIKRVQFSFHKLLKALVCTLILEVAFVIIIGFIFAVAWGRSLGYAYPIMVILLTLIFGIKTFLHFLKNEVLGFFQLRVQLKALLKKIWRLKKIVKMKY